MVILSCSALQRWEGSFRANLWVYPELRLSLVLDSSCFSIILIQSPRHFTTSLLREDARLQVFQPLCIRLPYNQLWKCPSVHATLLDAISDVAKKTWKTSSVFKFIMIYDDLCMYHHVFICFHMYSTNFPRNQIIGLWPLKVEAFAWIQKDSKGVLWENFVPKSLQASNIKWKLHTHLNVMLDDAGIFRFELLSQWTLRRLLNRVGQATWH